MGYSAKIQEIKEKTLNIQVYGLLHKPLGTSLTPN